MSDTSPAIGVEPKTDESSVVDPILCAPYACICWMCNPQDDGTKARVTIGWSLPDDSAGKVMTGAWAFEVQSTPRPPGRARILPLVEEPVGVLYPSVSNKLLELNERCERLIADHLLVFAHRALFGQALDAIASLPPRGITSDRLLILGPRLPKLVGRLCYSHFSRRKTIAILSPRRDVGKRPRMSSGAWPSGADQPEPPYYDDSAVRRWQRSSVPSDGPETIAAFELINGVGDALGTQVFDIDDVGSSMWSNKAAALQALLDVDREEIRTGIWQNVPVFLPGGMNLAIKSALLNSAESQARERWSSIELTLKGSPPLEQQRWKEFEHKLSADRRFPSAIYDFARCAAFEVFRKRDGGITSASPRLRLAARTTEEWNSLLDRLVVAVREQLGESLI